MELYGGWDIEGSVELWIFGMEICSVLGLRCAWVDGKLWLDGGIGVGGEGSRGGRGGDGDRAAGVVTIVSGSCNDGLSSVSSFRCVRDSWFCSCLINCSWKTCWCCSVNSVLCRTASSCSAASLSALLAIAVAANCATATLVFWRASSVTWPATGNGSPTGGSSASGTSASPSSRLLLLAASCRCLRTCSNLLLGSSISSSPDTTISSGSECILSSPIWRAFSSQSRLWCRNSWRLSNCSWQRGHMCASVRSLASSGITLLISSSEHDPELSPKTKELVTDNFSSRDFWHDKLCVFVVLCYSGTVNNIRI